MICEHCGASFERRSNAQKYCSSECGKAATQAYQCKYRDEHREERKEYDRQYRAAHKDEIKRRRVLGK